MKCKICGSDSDLFGEAIVLEKHRACFYRCRDCGFIQVQDPHWLAEAYDEAITKSDIGLAGRNFKRSRQTGQLLTACFDAGGRFVDFGGGYGLFVRLMRDQGFDFYRYDPLCPNLFADRFDADPDAAYDLLTAWEVFEHLEDPLAEIEKMASLSRTLFFSTNLLPRTPRNLDDWWYYGLEHGQHISFYSERTLQVIAGTFGLQLGYSNGFLHLLSDRAMPPLRLKIALENRYRWLRRFVAGSSRRSLLEMDHAMVSGVGSKKPGDPGAG